MDVRSNDKVDQTSVRALIRAVRTQPWLWVGFSCHWLWQWALAQVFSVNTQTGASDTVVWTGWVASFVVVALVSGAYAVLYKRWGWVIPPRVSTPLAAICLAISSLLFLMVSTPAVRANRPLLGVLAVLFALFVGVGQATLIREWGRIFSCVGARGLVYHGTAATISGTAVIMLLNFFPSAAAACCAVVAPLGGAVCIRLSYGRINEKGTGFNESASGKDMLRIPWKLLLTVMVQGLAFGILHNLALLGCFPLGAWSVYGIIAFFLASVLFFVSASCLRMDFNNMLYKAGFTVMALGFMLVVLLGFNAVVGYFLLCFGFRYTDMLIWVLCAHFMSGRRLPANWIMGVTACAWIMGRFFGFVLSGVSFFMEAYTQVDVLFIIAAVCVPLAALFLSNHNNLLEGWGIEKAGDRPDVLNACVLELSHACSLTKREEEILHSLVKGGTQKDISSQLFLSPQTVKTHIKHIYSKMGIHSYKELTRLVATTVDELSENRLIDSRQFFDKTSR